MPSNLAQWQVSEFAARGTQLQDMLVNRLINKLNNNSLIQDTNTFMASILMPFEIVKISSPTHQLKSKRTSCQAVIDASINSQQSEQQLATDQSSSYNQDLIIIIEIATIHMPRMLVEDFYDPQENRTTRACMVSFYPEFELDNAMTSHREKPSIVHILVDMSNSMKENNLIKWSRTLALCMLNQLPTDCFFNVTLFGSHFEQAFPYELKNTSSNIDKAREFLRRSGNPKGNTDVLSILREHFSLTTGNNNDDISQRLRPTNFLLISDGHFTRPNELFASLRRSQVTGSGTRVFACSLGSNANTFFMKTISRLTNASCEEFNTSLKSKWTRKCADLMDKCRQPAAVSDIRIEWQNMRPDISVQAPSKIGKFSSLVFFFIRVYMT